MPAHREGCKSRDNVTHVTFADASAHHVGDVSLLVVT
jgi:hypothetical protein